jgi:hypothetical protein
MTVKIQSFAAEGKLDEAAISLVLRIPDMRQGQAASLQ